FGVTGAGEFPEDRLRVIRNHINERPTSGEIVLIGIDEKSVREVGRWPWPRGRYAQLIDAIEGAGPTRQVHDILFPDRSDPVEDRLLASAVKRSKDITLAFLPRVGSREGQAQNLKPLPEFAEHA